MEQHTCNRHAEKETVHKRVQTVWSHLHEVQKRKKLIKGKKDGGVRFQWERTWEECLGRQTW